MTLRRASRQRIASRLGDWLTPMGHDLDAKPLLLAESLPIFTIDTSVSDDTPTELWLRNTGQHLHLLRDREGVRGWVRTHKKNHGSHQIHAVSVITPLPKLIDTSIDELASAGFKKLSTFRIISIRTLGVTALWAAERPDRSLICISDVHSGEDGLRQNSILEIFEFRKLISERISKRNTSMEKRRRVDK